MVGGLGLTRIVNAAAIFMIHCLNSLERQHFLALNFSHPCALYARLRSWSALLNHFLLD